MFHLFRKNSFSRFYDPLISTNMAWFKVQIGSSFGSIGWWYWWRFKEGNTAGSWRLFDANGGRLRTLQAVWGQQTPVWDQLNLTPLLFSGNWILIDLTIYQYCVFYQKFILCKRSPIGLAGFDHLTKWQFGKLLLCKTAVKRGRLRVTTLSIQVLTAVKQAQFNLLKKFLVGQWLWLSWQSGRFRYQRSTVRIQTLDFL